MSKPWKKLIVALDLTSEKKIKAIVRALAPYGVCFKVGPIAYTRFGPQVIRWIRNARAEVFLDFKLYDIPNTMSQTAKQFVGLGVWAFTIHAKAGKETVSHIKREISKEAKRLGKRRSKIVAVTELTSQKASVQDILKLAKNAATGGADGIVCSVWEAAAIKKKNAVFVITPGIRNGACGDDQRRIATVKEALAQGSDYFVVGRPIVAKRDYRKAAEEILEF